MFVCAPPTSIKSFTFPPNAEVIEGEGLSLNTFNPFKILPNTLPTLLRSVPINCAAEFCLLLPNPGNAPSGFKLKAELFNVSFNLSL